MLTRHAITKRADEDGVGALVAERDYVLAHVVAQLYRASPDDGGQLVFKGGTALRLVHIDDYRYSADLDFTVRAGTSSAALTALADAIAAAKEHAGLPHLELVESAQPSLLYVGPLAAAEPRKVKVDLATDEHVESIEERSIKPVWTDLPPPVAFPVYPLDEISAEKLRCVIQREQCRDLYDLYRLVDDMNVSLREVRPLFERKTQSKGIDPALFPDRFEKRLERYRRKWDEEMCEHLADPPRLDDVLRIVRRHLRSANLL